MVRRKRYALTLIETLLMLVVLSFIGLAVGVGLQAAARVPSANDRILVISAQLNSDMDYWRAVAFGPAPWPTTYPYARNDTVTFSLGGRPQTFSRTVTIKKWDPTNLASNPNPRDDFVQVQITIDGHILTAYLAAPL